MAIVGALPLGPCECFTWRQDSREDASAADATEHANSLAVSTAMNIPPSLQVGDTVILNQDHRSSITGYLPDAAAGDRVTVLYVGRSNEETGWLYVCHARGAPQGWLGAEFVDLEGLPAQSAGHRYQSAASIAPPAADSCSALGSASNSDSIAVSVQHVDQLPDNGYLRMKAGTRVEILYQGSSHTSDLDWCYAKSLSSGEKGWLAKRYISTVFRMCTGKPESTQTNLPDGAVVMELSHYFTGKGSRMSQVQNRDGVIAWVPSDELEIIENAKPWRTLIDALPQRPQISEAPKSEISDLPPKPRRPPPRDVELLTFGLETLVCDLSEKVNRCGGTIQISDDELRIALAQRGFSNVSLIVDARCFPDPSSVYNHTLNCNGTHPEIVARICNHRKFKLWLSKLKRQFALAIAQGGPDLKFTMAMYCRSGKHRSVAAAVIAKHILEYEGWRCSPLNHLSMRFWTRKMRNDLYQDEDLVRADALEKALKMWSQV